MCSGRVFSVASCFFCLLATSSKSAMGKKPTRRPKEVNKFNRHTLGTVTCRRAGSSVRHSSRIYHIVLPLLTFYLFFPILLPHLLSLFPFVHLVSLQLQAPATTGFPNISIQSSAQPRTHTRRQNTNKEEAAAAEANPNDASHGPERLKARTNRGIGAVGYSCRPFFRRCQ